MRATSRLAAAALALPLVLTACAEKARVVPTDHATPIAVPSVPATVFPRPSSLAPTTEAPSVAPTGGATSAPPAGGGNAVKATNANTFEPATLKVKVGTKVVWTSEAGGFHSVTSGTPEAPDAAGPLQSPLPFTNFEYTFTKAGTYKYFCQPHASLKMVGEVVVS